MTRENLIPARRIETRNRIRRLRKWATALGVYGAMLGVAYAACFAFGGDDGKVVLEKMRQSTERFRKAGKKIHALRTSLAEASNQIAAARALSQSPDWSLLLAMVAGNLGDDVVLERCSLTPVDTGGQEKPSDGAPPAAGAEALGAGQVLYQRYLLDLSGFARSQMGVSEFVLRLEKSRLFESIRLIKTQTRGFMDGQAVSFRVECALSGKGDNRP